MAIAFDDMLNGAGAAPAYQSVQASVLPLPTMPKDGMVDSAALNTTTGSRTILLAWVLVIGLLIACHVLTLSVQR